MVVPASTTLATQEAEAGGQILFKNKKANKKGGKEGEEIFLKHWW